MGHAVLAPARPSDLLAHILANCAHPTTLVVCASREQFVRAVAADALRSASSDATGLTTTPSLLQTAIARHIRVAFVASVAHLRAFLAAFRLSASRVPPPPPSASASNSASTPIPASTDNIPITAPKPWLLVYGFLMLHRDTSEWSGQGLSATAAACVEAAWRSGLHAVLVDSPDASGTFGGHDALDERVPVLSTVARRQLQKAGYPLHTQPLRTVLSRWFKPATLGEYTALECSAPTDTQETAAAAVAAEAGTMATPAAPAEAAPPTAVEQIHGSHSPPPASPPRRTFVADSEDESLPDSEESTTGYG